jgi:hypothetical protein
MVTRPQPQRSPSDMVDGHGARLPQRCDFATLDTYPMQGALSAAPHKRRVTRCARARLWRFAGTASPVIKHGGESR